MSFIKALIVSLAIDAVWIMCEYDQFGELQLGRECDNVVWWLYLIVIWYLFWKLEDGE
jgi:hypothetical protein